MDVLSILDRYGLISEKTEVSGNYIRVPCPFHSEEVASMSVRVDNGIFHCFGCEWKGNMQKFVKEIEKCNDLQALMIIKKYSNFTFKQKKPKNKRELLEGAYLQYVSANKVNWHKMQDNYMIKKRKFKPSTLKKFKVKIEDGSHYYPIMIPILDNGKFKGTLRRRVDDSDRYKYLNNKGFSRKFVLGGEYKDGWTLVVEGYLDMMMAWQLGYRNIACMFHWKASDYQIKKLRRFTDKLIVATDNTPTGLDGYKYLSKFFKTKRFLYPDNCKDIGDMRSKYVFKKCLYDTIKRR
jgi:DNA primase